MKQRLRPLVVCLGLLGFVSAPTAFAATDTSSQSAQSLEKRLDELQAEVAALRKELKTKTASSPAKRTAARPMPQSQAAALNARENQQTLDRMATLERKAEAGEAKADANLPEISGPQYLPESGIQYLPVDVDVPGQSFVSTGPYIGVPLQFSGSNLIINHPSVNEDVSLLDLRKNIAQRLLQLGLKPQDEHSHLLLSGVVEGQAIYKEIGQNSSTNSDIDLTNVGLDAYFLGPSSWTSGLISFRYDNNLGTQTGSLNNNSRSQNSHVFVDKAFIVLGDFTKSPFYGTLGQMYVPFGTFSSSLVSSPLTKLLARTQERAIVAGFQQQDKNAFFGSAFIFKGDSHTGTVNRINDGGLNIGYKFDNDYFSGNIGGSVLGNLADSQGMQNTGNSASTDGVPSTFGGFGAVNGTGNEVIVHKVPAYDIRTLLSIGKGFDFLVEYITASTNFNPADMTMNSTGAKPQALDTELAYTFQSLSIPTSATIGYAMTKDALALGLPAQRYSLALNASFWRNTLQSIELRHDVNYAASSTSSGSGVPGPIPSGKTDNALTAQFGIYF